MAILKEFSCKAHGSFEAWVQQDETPKCPKGCSKRFVTREYLTPPSINGAVVGTLDQMQKDIAKDFNLSNLKVSEKDGTSVMENLRKGEKPQDFAPFWATNPDPKKMLGDFKPTDVLKPDTLPSVGKSTQIQGRYDAPLPEV